MKNKFFTLAATFAFIGFLLTGCQTSTKKIDDAQVKVQDAKNEMIEANDELNQAINDSIQLFRKEAAEKIKANEQSIAEFRARIAVEKMENKAQYEKELAELEQKNRDMKRTLDEVKAEGKEKWLEFKADFSQKMNDLNTSFKNFLNK
ncbi:MAG: hypothetical protein WCX31_02100 [Salinivirgaceae bacterium]|jgi:hypothetical protein